MAGGGGIHVVVCCCNENAAELKVRVSVFVAFLHLMFSLLPSCGWLCEVLKALPFIACECRVLVA